MICAVGAPAPLETAAPATSINATVMTAVNFRASARSDRGFRFPNFIDGCGFKLIESLIFDMLRRHQVKLPDVKALRSSSDRKQSPPRFGPEHLYRRCKLTPTPDNSGLPSVLLSPHGSIGGAGFERLGVQIAENKLKQRQGVGIGGRSLQHQLALRERFLVAAEMVQG